jgi:hypothetical protein
MVPSPLDRSPVHNTRTDREASCLKGIPELLSMRSKGWRGLQAKLDRSKKRISVIDRMNAQDLVTIPWPAQSRAILEYRSVFRTFEGDSPQLTSTSAWPETGNPDGGVLCPGPPVVLPRPGWRYTCVYIHAFGLVVPHVLVLRHCFIPYILRT